MQSTFSIWSTSRQNFLKFLSDYSIEQLNYVPAHFNNNLIWNIGHVIVTQQLLVYGAVNQPLLISTELVNRYKAGSKPTGEVTQSAADELKELLISLQEKTIIDFENQLLINPYTEKVTRSGFVLRTIEEAMEFNNYHEGMHLGMMMSLRKFV